MSADLKPIYEYIEAIEKELVAGNATEHTHRPALKALIERIADGVTATNEPTRIKCGAPDFLITKGVTTIGYIEAKDVGKSLDEAEKSEQLQRYRNSLTNLMLTDYLEFRWYVDGENRLSARLGSITNEGKIERDKAGIQTVSEFLTNFLSSKAEGVGTPKELALRMARLAHLIRNLIVNAFENEAETGGLHSQLAAFRDNLIPDLSVEYFADMYAQTIAYGLFAARCAAPDSKYFTRQNAAYLLPKTNPFLRKLFNTIAGPDLDDRIAWLVDDLAQVLAQADMSAIIQDFGKRIAKEDPVVHFYKTFLNAYDPKVREMRGVYYTPEPVVSYIVRSIDYLLKTYFNRPRGLADSNTLILDPAVGTATFLYMVVNEIYNVNVAQGQKGLWNDYVEEKLLPRILGFEILMAPYAVAHLKLGLLLQETGYQFHTDQRLGIYLTNTLEEAIKHTETLFARWISEEANAAARVKKDEPIMVVLGNPPYSGHSANKGKWAKQLVERYKIIDGKPLGEKNPKWLQDDYVKFLSFGQWRIEHTGQGVLGFITNHSYLDNPTFRGMRHIDRVFYSDKGAASIFPLYLYPNEGEMLLKEGRFPNLNSEFIKAFSGKLGMKFIEDGKGDLKETFGPENIFDYAYAIFHSPTYRSRYGEFLKTDFPHLPLTSDKELFRGLAEKGGELVSLHLMGSPLLEKLYTQVKFDVPGLGVVEKVSYDDKTQRVSINKAQYFEGVSPEVWNFHIGGYQVCDKWLKDRQKVKRKLTVDETQHYQKVVVVIKETIRLMSEIDSLITEWPIK